MRSEARGVERRWSAGDFARRVEPAQMPEWMDEPCSTEELRACLRDIERVNWLTMSYGPTLGFLRRVMRGPGAGMRLHVVDVGSGYGDMLRVIWRWARRRRLPVRLTGIDLQPVTREIAMEATRDAGMAGDAIEWRSGDAMTDGGVRRPDVVISSLVTHHMSREEVVRFVRWMEGSARVGWFVSDLKRQRGPAIWFGVLARALRWHAFVQHDGPVSFRRAFRVEEWERMLREAGVPEGAARVRRVFPARVCVERIR